MRARRSAWARSPTGSRSRSRGSSRCASGSERHGNGPRPGRLPGAAGPADRRELRPGGSPIAAERQTTLSLKPIEPRRAFEEILDRLEEAILAGQLSAGDRLPPERELAAQLGVSRTSVREALRVLEALGLVEVKTGAERGATLREEAGNAFADVLRFLVALGHLTAETVLEFRLVLQVWAAGRVAEHRDENLLGVLRGLVARMETESLGPDGFPSVDVEFHLAVVRGAGNELATLVFEAIRHSIEHVVLDTFLREPDWPSLRETLTREHREILAAIESGDAETARRLVGAHIRGFWAPRFDGYEAVDRRAKPPQGDR